MNAERFHDLVHDLELALATDDKSSAYRAVCQLQAAADVLARDLLQASLLPATTDGELSEVAHG